MSQPIRKSTFSIAVLTFLAVILAMVMIPQAVAAAKSGSESRISYDYLNREYSYTYRNSSTSTTYSSKGVLVSRDDGLLVFAIEMTNGSTHYKAIPVDSLISMHTIDDTH